MLHFSLTYAVVGSPSQDPAHPRAAMKHELKEWCQATHTECLAQIAMFAQGRDALRRDPTVNEALRAVADAGLSDIARQHAQAALLALSDTEKVKPKALHDGTTGDHEGQKHIMLSCECALMHFAHSGAIVAVGNRSSDTAG
jgi:hypothetical protein|eukprot:COSAG06_NODE_4947_length_3839_cov_5.234383_5_plen_142_part_00